MDNCAICEKPSSSYLVIDGQLICRWCAPAPEAGCRLFEYGHENPMDPKGSTAHVRDIKARRYDNESKKVYYEKPSRTYFFGGSYA
jgi:hypothetical protein